MIGLKNLYSRRWPYVVLIVFSIGATALVTALLLNIFEKKVEERTPFVRVVEVDGYYGSECVGKELAKTI